MNRRLAWALRLLIVGTIAGISVFAFNSFFEYVDGWTQFARSGPETLPEIKSGQKVMVVAPHPDDETIPLGGWLARGAANGATIRAVIVTNGDGFSLQTAQYLERFLLRPEDFIRNGKLRQRESLRATENLGYGKDVEFLGFPDEGILPIWEDHWTGSFRSPFTKVDRSPYSRAYRRSSPYEGRVVLEQLTELIAVQDPDILVIPSRHEAHPDHYAVSLFATAAIFNPSIERRPLIIEYIVHRGGYPYPFGLYPYAYLPPPRALINNGNEWRAYFLDELARAKKAAGLVQYRSQFFFAGYDIAGFYRRNEIGSIGGSIFSIIEGDPSKPDALPPVARDPIGDTTQRLYQPSGDIVMLRLVDAGKLYAVASFDAEVNGGVDYRIDVRSFGAGLEESVAFTYPGEDKRVRVKGKNIIVELPAGFETGSGAIFVEVRTMGAGTIDLSAAFFEE